MSFMDRAKAAAEQMRAKAQEGVEEVQARKELAQAYWDLGHKAHELASRGEISNPELDPLVCRITDLLDRDEHGAGQGPPAPPAQAPEPASATQPEQATDATPPQTPA